jgi:hypothetical protein
MTELFDLNSWNCWPTSFIEITDGASLGLIDTERSCPTASSCGTITFSRAMTAIQPTMTTTANLRMFLGRKG